MTFRENRTRVKEKFYSSEEHFFNTNFRSGDCAYNPGKMGCWNNLGDRIHSYAALFTSYLKHEDILITLVAGFAVREPNAVVKLFIFSVEAELVTKPKVKSPIQPPPQFLHNN
jgi:hypothetical protein